MPGPPKGPKASPGPTTGAPIPATLRRKALTPAQQKARDELDIRTALIQARGVKVPPSGTFGKG